MDFSEVKSPELLGGRVSQHVDAYQFLDDQILRGKTRLPNLACKESLKPSKPRSNHLSLSRNSRRSADYRKTWPSVESHDRQAD
jgi:hypothetical protein